MDQRSKRHHYLPHFYLQRFTGADGLLCLFDRETKTFRRQKPLNTALQKDFSTLANKHGVKSDGIERMLSQLDAEGGCVIRRLDSRDAVWRDEQERVSFAIFLGYFYTRTPAFDQEQTALVNHLYRAWMKANHPTPEVTAQWFRQFSEETGETADPEIVE